ncbi:MAG: AI-2E family transporter [Salinarimonadaceae bacterium]|nr:MAG: AI-2E family transporter [Salinarimonadaceae bacterium]
MRSIEDFAFLALIIAVSFAFAWILSPFFGAILWGVALAVAFAPLTRMIARRMGGRRNIAAFTTVMIVLAIVVTPTVYVGTHAAQEAMALYNRVDSGELDLASYFEQLRAALPEWALGLLDWMGVSSLGALETKINAGLLSGSEIIATQAIGLGQSAFFVIVHLVLMLYLLYFLLRDEEGLSRWVSRVLPLDREKRDSFVQRFNVVIRATLKGDMLVALLQGTLGGLMFWALGIPGPVLWGVAMAFLALMPVVGTSLIWAPVAVYLLATGDVGRGVTLFVYGVLVIGLADNIVRPMLIGKDTRMSSYVVLISTLGGIASFGLNGILIGPMIAALFISGWDIMTTTRREATAEAEAVAVSVAETETDPNEGSMRIREAEIVATRTGSR